MKRWAVLSVLLSIGCGGAATARPDHAASAAEARAKSAADLVEQGRAYADAGDALRAQQYFAAAIRLGADEHVVLPLLLRACVADRNYRLAAEVAETAITRRPHDARLRFLTGALYGTLGDTARSRAHLERAAKELPEDAEVQFAVGVFFRDDAYDIALADGYFRRYLALAPRGAHADEARGSLMVRLEHDEAAQ